MNFYSNTKPKLFNLKIEDNLEKVVCEDNLYPKVHDKITEFLLLIFKNHVRTNWILLLIVVIIILLLYYRHQNKVEEHYEDDVEKDLDDLIDEQINETKTCQYNSSNNPDMYNSNINVHNPSNIQQPNIQQHNIQQPNVPGMFNVNNQVYNTYEQPIIDPNPQLVTDSNLMNHTEQNMYDSLYGAMTDVDELDNLDNQIVPPYAE